MPSGKDVLSMAELMEALSYLDLALANDGDISHHDSDESSKSLEAMIRIVLLSFNIFRRHHTLNQAFQSYSDEFNSECPSKIDIDHSITISLHLQGRMPYIEAHTE